MGINVASYKNQKFELSGWILIKGIEIQFELAGVWSYPSWVNRVKMTEKLARVKTKGIETQFELAEEFELSEFELPGFHCI